MFESLGKFGSLFSNMGAMKKNFDEFKQKMSEFRINESVGGGMVNVTCDGNGNIIDLKINKELFEEEDFKILEELIISATNNAIKKSKSLMEEEAKNAMKNVNLSEISKMFQNN